MIIKKFVDGLHTKYYYDDSACTRLIRVETFSDPSYNISHNENGPAVISYGINGKIEMESYSINGKCHRDGDLPAIIFYDDNGLKDYEYWYIHSKQHRENGPAFIRYKNGKVVTMLYKIDGLTHREDGPAWITFLDRNKPDELYYIKDKKISKDKFLKKYLPLEYADYMKNKTYVIDHKKYKIVSIHGNGKRITLEQV